MLDASFNAKLGDFGLARLVDHGRGTHTTVLAGTMGYMDPECMVTGSTCIKSDVYSFGVVVLEIACGRPPTIEVTKDTIMHLVQWVWEFYSQGSLMQLIFVSTATLVSERWSACWSPHYGVRTLLTAPRGLPSGRL
jgi:serine/threonine protein kinase